MENALDQKGKLRKNSYRDTGFTERGEWESPNPDPVSVFFGSELFVGVVIATVRGEHGDFSASAYNRLSGFTKVLPDCCGGRVRIPGL